MKKIALLLLLLPYLAFGYSPHALAYLAGEHRKVNPTHQTQYQTIINKKEIMKYTLVNLNNYIYNLQKYEFLIFNHFLILSQDEFIGTKKQ